jgi:hypothetical protein
MESGDEGILYFIWCVKVLSFDVLFNFILLLNTAELMESCMGYHFED